MEHFLETVLVLGLRAGIKKTSFDSCLRRFRQLNEESAITAEDMAITILNTSFKSANDIYSNPMLSPEIWAYYEMMEIRGLWEQVALEERLPRLRFDIMELFRYVKKSKCKRIKKDSE